ncbi:4'-phosphopantetheinyl transferase superfamily protein [Ferruginibacter sp. HRS2-29]|uniref:4'-phosphopantetheinyl transferase family protein n=1 Tax=Ferruginibacter sp. HRS2-29 TaxID=2487334 RepID=UPI0020CE6DA8|nr:4'-phosphopantetheinyl transferase superfamily protein [Ferruginibacter sp. HRS2-29]MCP9749408.1 4'-phosphopantetheinyl transferase superfamily protein [Ferruginibacter sp. HRS2-29]
MPLVYQQNINENTKLGVWHITEDEPFFLQKVVLQNEITHPHKRLQHLAGRYVLQALFPGFPLELIRVADTRKPFLPGEKYHFSISHCSDYAAVIVSTKSRVGVDIELPQEKIERIKYKYLTEPEMQLVLDLPVVPLDALTMAWSIKEAMFKWYGNGKVDFRQHMVIRKIAASDFAFSADCIFTKEEDWPVKVHALMFNGISLAFLITDF